jgi:hypothetical protein
MSKLQQILDNFPDEEFVILDGLDEAVIGVLTDSEPMRLVYSINDIVDCFVAEGMSEDEAIENYEYNTARAVPYIPNAPLLIYTDFF